jgi:pSer/pThr/pTyr-binding forkhead associated (FHA) protein
MSAATKLNTQPNIKLVVQKGPHAGQRFAFSKSKITIGRSPENDIILVNDPLISRQHAYIQISNNDVEIVNQSAKNPIFVNNESVNKWKLTNDTIFMIGDTEFLIQIENQQSVVVMKPQALEVPSLVHQPAVPKNNLKVVPKTQKAPQTIARKPEGPKFYPQNGAPPQMQQAPPQFNMAPAPPQKQPNNKMIFYVIMALVIGAGGYLFMGDSASSGAKKRKPATLKYSDETAFKLNSQEAVDNIKKQEKAILLKQSSAYLRAEENFAKGSRAFQLGNYASSIEFFQLALTTNSEHVLAKRYLYLSKVRFDEVVKAKLDLGQSYFERNNFKLCQSMFQQVIDMLSPKEMLQAESKDTNLQLARTMLKKCEFAAEGIH